MSFRTHVSVPSVYKLVKRFQVGYRMQPVKDVITAFLGLRQKSFEEDYFLL